MSAPTIVPTELTSGLRPPSEHADKPFHWICRRSDDPSDAEPMAWYGGGWQYTGLDVRFSPEEAAEDDWRYIGPCESPKKIHKQPETTVRMP